MTIVEFAIVRQRAIPVIRAADPEKAYVLCERLVAAGIDVIELTATIPRWDDTLAAVSRDLPHAMIGMGTVVSADAAEKACAAGARFLVSPFPADEARAVADREGVLFIGGGCTPAEIAEASSHGLCKLFPAHLGGLGYLGTLHAILPEARIMPTGGIRLNEVSSWLRAGATAVGVGGDLYGAPDLDAAIAELARQVSEGAPA
ncbi:MULTISPECIES: bifunctional 4-hydroxy-2-oxoglutarate aldolase/2-dehydro-3-deoxy-phosphogluconate aldolase [Microbacterium]|uniref:bifunctional 4-hydroxy-2-oxoglutarate aldolase/2-dehydro-3-deoxy-phosphogluconate aldolase n=1 Tax=Microbacterium TaxID=33882 RepID=UPI001BB1E232|nr:aldolase [Microbacterium sp. 4NA327F11]MCK9913335.1 aldolase [Microbacteriaceae bacterium K1510]